MDVDQNSKDVDSFNILAQKQCEQAKARLIEALTRIEELKQEAEVMSFFCIGFKDIFVNFMLHCLLLILREHVSWKDWSY